MHVTKMHPQNESGEYFQQRRCSLSLHLPRTGLLPVTHVQEEEGLKHVQEEGLKLLQVLLE